MKKHSLSELLDLDLVYLATPYTNYEFGLDEAFIQACKLAGQLIQRGLRIYCPIAHGHTISHHAKMDKKDHAMWMRIDEVYIRKSDGILVGKLRGWENSRGVDHERKQFHLQRKPIYFIDPDTLEVVS